MKRFNLINSNKIILFFLIYLSHYGFLHSVLVYKDYISYNYETNKYFSKRIYDFSLEKDIKSRKKLFCDFMYLVIETENNDIYRNRKEIIRLKEKNRLTLDELNFINNLEKVYKIDISERSENIQWNKLLRRVDIVPKELAISQTAIESGWGTSVFAKKANNLFGHWTYQIGSGIVPSRRDEGQTHEIAIFNSVNDSVKKYMLNINTNSAYKHLRELRAELRSQNKELDGRVLSSGLINYSGVGDTYVKTINLIINDISKYWSLNDKRR